MPHFADVAMHGGDRPNRSSDGCSGGELKEEGDNLGTRSAIQTRRTLEPDTLEFLMASKPTCGCIDSAIKTIASITQIPSFPRLLVAVLVTPSVHSSER